MTRTQWIAAAAALFFATSAPAATPAERCASNKNKEAAKYVECRHKVEAKFALTGDIPAYHSARQKCADVHGVKWSAIESRAGGTCPSTGDQALMQRYLDTATASVARALAGGTLTGQGQRLATGQTRCWNTSGQIVSCPGTGQDGEFQSGLDRVYVDNGDGTITDTRTGLMWEKLSDDGSIHDRDNSYYWPNHLAKAAGLNQQGFAGYTDWRIPNVHELQSLVDYGRSDPAIPPAFHTACVPGCTVFTCSCTALGYSPYWTSSVIESNPTRMWSIEFFYGDVRPSEYANQRARGVRGGS